MKLLNCLLFIIVISSCSAQTNSDTMLISYEAITRGSSIKLKATSTQVSYNGIKTTKVFEPTYEYWSALTALIQEINLSDLENFTVPSESNTVDAALQATLSIQVKNKTYYSQTFDHGNPPAELKPIIDKLFSIIDVE